ncbi:MT-A70-domain-containing protein [Chytriomyces sp. MP71]|nr:MT-A70-domain-containing protein [Chytriomyces sp. MP71]
MSRQPMRRSKRSGTKVSGAWYVGYADDSESIADIMRKFDELEHLKSEVRATAVASSSSFRPVLAAVAAADGGSEDTEELASHSTDDTRNVTNASRCMPAFLETEAVVDGLVNFADATLDQNALEELFRRTSSTVVKAAQAQRYCELQRSEYLQRLFEGQHSELDVDDMEAIKSSSRRGQENPPRKLPFKVLKSAASLERDHLKAKSRKRKMAVLEPSDSTGNSGESSLSGHSNGNSTISSLTSTPLHDFTTTTSAIEEPNLSRGPQLTNPSKASNIRKTQSLPKPDVDGPIHIRIPNPLTRTWGRSIETLECKLLREKAACKNYNRVDTNILESGALKPVKDLCNPLVVYMDPPLVMTHTPGEENGYVSIEEFSEIDVPSLITSGFLFIWIEKEFTPSLLKITEKWGFRYVENFVWVKWDKWHRIAAEEGQFFRKSKTTCFIFRKDAEDMELRHQRNPDCEFDFIKPPEKKALTQKKPEMIYVVIETMLPDAHGAGRMVELWARKDAPPRSGWTQVFQKDEQQ